MHFNGGFGRAAPLVSQPKSSFRAQGRGRIGQGGGAAPRGGERARRACDTRAARRAARLCARPGVRSGSIPRGSTSPPVAGRRAPSSRLRRTIRELGERGSKSALRTARASPTSSRSAEARKPQIWETLERAALAHETAAKTRLEKLGFPWILSSGTSVFNELWEISLRKKCCPRFPGLDGRWAAR